MLDYLGRYTHRVAMSNDRLVSLEDGRVTVRWRDYKSGNKQKLMTLDASEFIRRFLLHALPRGFVRIRHFGWLANAQRRRTLALLRELLGAQSPVEPQAASPDSLQALHEKLTGQSLTICPVCRQGRMVEIDIIHPIVAIYQPAFAIDSS